MIPDEIKLVTSLFVQKNWKMFCLIVGLIIAAYASLFWLPKDNPVEEIAEDIIEAETGVKLDLTP